MEYLQRGSLRLLVTKLDLAQVGGGFEGLLAGPEHAHQWRRLSLIPDSPAPAAPAPETPTPG
jgi:hypothetical protein